MFIVTGASAGIGRAVAAELAGRGQRVLAVARSAALLKDLADAGAGSITAVVADVATSAGVDSIVAAVDGGDISGVVHSAASLVPLEQYSELDPAQLIEHMRVHVAAPIAIYQALAASSSIGRLVFIDSYSATTPRAGWPAYSTVKAAAQMAARCAALDLPATRVIRVFPGAVNTQVVLEVLASGGDTARVFGEMLERGEVAEPFEVARFIAALLVDASDELLGSRECWDYNNSADREAASA